jgi:hypothetical protein
MAELQRLLGTQGVPQKVHAAMVRGGANGGRER